MWAHARHGAHLQFVPVFLLAAFGLYVVAHLIFAAMVSRKLVVHSTGYERYGDELIPRIHVSPAAKRQPKTGRLFCFAMSTEKFHQDRVPAINTTWLQKCDAGHVFTNSRKHMQNVPFHTVFQEIPDDYMSLFWKSRMALYYAYNVSKDFDWYFKSDDDTYLIVERLRTYLDRFDPDEPLFLGFRLKRRFVRFPSRTALSVALQRSGYNAGGSGYVISRRAMQMFAKELF
uniref:N-acetylgalactosaminide beta-1,3-galactosyltransferase n=1 Tax=Steinernema glaseri TaxID=37863 RepID=A0A1I8A994_9BILA